MKILIVDDDPVSRTVLQKILAQEATWDVLDAVEGAKGWELLEQGQIPDLCIMELSMPSIDGLELLEKIRQDGPLKDMPIMVCSGVSDRDTIVKVASFNIRAYLLKPLSAAKVLTTGRKIAQELGVATPLEEPHAVQLRLGISSVEHQEMLHMLLKETDAALGDIKSALEQGDKDAALGRMSSIRGGCQNLGASGLAASFAKLEKLLATQEAQDVIAAVDLIQMDKMHLQEACAVLAPAKQSDTDDTPSAADEDAPAAASAAENQPAQEDETRTETPNQASHAPTQEPVEASQQDDDASAEDTEDAKAPAATS